MSETLCDRCGEQLGAPHAMLDTDCVIPHGDHEDRYVGMLCRRHYHHVDDVLVQIEELWALRGYTLLPGPSGDERHGTRFGSPAPGNLSLMALTDGRAKTPVDLEPGDVPDLPGTLASWARMVVEERQTTDVLVGDVVQSVRVLRRERKWIAGQPWVDDYVHELDELHRHLAVATRGGMWPQSVGKCPNCQAKLYVTIGLDQITCGRCRSHWEGVALARLRYILDQEASA